MPRVSYKTWSDRKDKGPAVGIYSFGANSSNGPAAQFEFDVTLFRDPTGQKQFNGLNGTDPTVRDWVSSDRRIPAVLDHCTLLAKDLLTPRIKNGHGDGEPISKWISFSFKDYHGKWIAPAVAEKVAERLTGLGFTVLVVHHTLKNDQCHIYPAE